MVEIDKIIITVVAFVGTIILYRILTPRRIETDYEHQIHDILTKEEYKVKGKFEQ